MVGHEGKSNGALTLGMVLCLIWASTGACRPHRGGTNGGPPPSGADLLTGCFVSGPVRSHQDVRLCLGPPEMPPAAFSLRESETVPDATLTDTCEGRYEVQQTTVILHVEHCRHGTYAHQIHQRSDAESRAAYDLMAWLLPSGELQYENRRGSQVVLRRLP